MLYKFKSKDTGDLIMLEVNGRRVLEIIGQDAGPKGIILPEQMPAAIRALQPAMAQEEADEKAEGPIDGLSLRQRATPFVEMLEHNYQSGNQVVWGV